MMRGKTNTKHYTLWGRHVQGTYHPAAGGLPGPQRAGERRQPGAGGCIPCRYLMAGRPDP
jgi:hypothetical protein